VQLHRRQRRCILQWPEAVSIGNSSRSETLLLHLGRSAQSWLAALHKRNGSSCSSELLLISCPAAVLRAVVAGLAAVTADPPVSETAGLQRCLGAAGPAEVKIVGWQPAEAEEDQDALDEMLLAALALLQQMPQKEACRYLSLSTAPLAVRSPKRQQIEAAALQLATSVPHLRLQGLRSLALDLPLGSVSVEALVCDVWEGLAPHQAGLHMRKRAGEQTRSWHYGIRSLEDVEDFLFMLPPAAASGKCWMQLRVVLSEGSLGQRVLDSFGDTQEVEDNLLQQLSQAFRDPSLSNLELHFTRHCNLKAELSRAARCLASQRWLSLTLPLAEYEFSTGEDAVDAIFRPLAPHCRTVRHLKIITAESSCSSDTDDEENLESESRRGSQLPLVEALEKLLQQNFVTASLSCEDRGGEDLSKLPAASAAQIEEVLQRNLKFQNLFWQGVWLDGGAASRCLSRCDHRCSPPRLVRPATAAEEMVHEC